MGMFDYINCEAPLPETEVAPPSLDFQSKDTPDQGMTVYTITADGRLMWRPYEIEEVPREERPYPDDEGFKGLFGSIRRIEKESEAVDFHGDIYFYTSNHPDVGWWEYRARFTNGKLDGGITLAEFRPPEGRDTNAEIMAREDAEEKARLAAEIDHSVQFTSDDGGGDGGGD